MKKLEKKTKKLICIILCCVLGAGAIIGMGFGFGAIPDKGEATAELWTRTQTFDVTKDVAASFSIEDGKHEEGFVVMNFADIQLSAFENQKKEDTFKMMKTAIETIDPDLITLTGDQVGGGYKKGILNDICEFLDGFGIPWAPVLGNHDGEGNLTRNANGDIYLQYKNVVFRKNDPKMGVGNYIINVTSAGKPVHAVIMIDSHNEIEYVGTGVGYDYIYDSQIDWYEWLIEGEQAINPDIKSSCFFHIPLVQYIDAWEGYQEGKYQGGNDKSESICCANYKVSPYDSGLYDAICKHGSTDLVIVGHDHTNNFYVDYNGVTLAYGMKSGYGSYYNEDRIGVTTVTIDKNGNDSLAYYRYNKNDNSLSPLR